MPHKDDQEQTDGLGDTAPFQAIEEGGSSDTPGDNEEQDQPKQDQQDDTEAASEQ